MLNSWIYWEWKNVQVNFIHDLTSALLHSMKDLNVNKKENKFYFGCHPKFPNLQQYAECLLFRSKFTFCWGFFCFSNQLNSVLIKFFISFSCELVYIVFFGLRRFLNVQWFRSLCRSVCLSAPFHLRIGIPIKFSESVPK